jgi:hypothetical protein
MLDERHFASETKNGMPTWNRLVKDGKVVQCKTCGKWITPDWHKDSTGTVNYPALLEPMTQCAICFFKKGGDKHG